jgi:hypothetical protein
LRGPSFSSSLRVLVSFSLRPGRRARFPLSISAGKRGERQKRTVLTGLFLLVIHQSISSSKKLSSLAPLARPHHTPSRP